MTKTIVKEREATLPLDMADAAPPAAKQQAAPVLKNNQVSVMPNHKSRASAEPSNILAAIAGAAANPKCNPDKMHALIDARDRLMKQEAHVAFGAAYIEMQSELPTINAKGRIEIAAKREGSKKQDTPYATYKEIQRVTKPILKKHKFHLI